MATDLPLPLNHSFAEHWDGNTWIGLTLLAGSPSVRIVLLEGRTANGDQSKELRSYACAR